MEATTPAGLNLQKGERGLVLDKDGGALKKLHMGAGWDVNAPNAKVNAAQKTRHKRFMN